jgi:mannitol-1-phosphate 5-dehydrogenase
MNSLINNKLVLFGAGKIGRSFIGQIFSVGGYEIVFVDVNAAVIEELNRKQSYQVCFINDEGKKCVTVRNVRGVHACNEKEIVCEVATSGLVAISVGVGTLSQTLPLIAKGLLKRYSEGNNDPLDIIIAENMVNAADYLRDELSKYLPSDYSLTQLVGLVETSVGKMVPFRLPGDEGSDLLKVYAEPYNTLIVDKTAFKNPVPKIDGLAPKQNMKAWVERKLYIHNLGHSAAAYLGYFYFPNLGYIYETLSIKMIFDQVKNAMLQSAAILIKKYPDEFTMQDMIDHVDDLLRRFQNKALGDTVYRVGCDLRRKLGAEDRLVGAIKSAVALDMPYDAILNALVCANYFTAKGPNGQVLDKDINFLKDYGDNLPILLSEICGFDRVNDANIFIEAGTIYNYLNATYLNRKINYS